MLLTAAQETSLAGFERLLETVAIRAGLVAESDRDRLRDRHVLDSLRAAPCVAGAGRVFDLGSGAGLPGIPLAIALPDTTFVLVEPRRRAVAFLELAVHELELRNVVVCEESAQDLARTGQYGLADACTARALGAASMVWTMSRPLLHHQGKCLYFAGGSWGSTDVAAVASRGGLCHECAPALFPSTGPVVIMTAAPAPRPREPANGR